MDGAENGLPCLGEFLKEVQGRPASLRIEARCWFVNEEKEWWLRNKFHANSQSLPLLNIQTFAKHTDHGIGVVLHVKELNDLLDIVKFLRFWDACRLSQ